MNRVRLLVIGSLVTFALTTVAQQATPGSGGSVVEKQLASLTEKLDLTADQQAKTKTILQQLDAATQKTMQDESVSRDERMDNVKSYHHQADKELRQILSDDQKLKLDQFEQQPHPEFHPNANAATPASSPHL
jgi:hypothetical protein